MDKPSILIAMNDKAEINAYAPMLSEAGFKVAIAHDGTDALQAALKTPPDAIIAEIELKGIPGDRLLEILKTNPAASNIPLLLISGSMADVRGFRPGFDGFALRPLNPEELVSRIRKMAETHGANKTGRANVIEGVLKHMSIADIIQFLHINKKEGELRITCPPERGAVYVKNGDIYDARLEAAGAEKALFRLLAWNSGRFEFIPCEIHLSREIRSSTSAALMEGMRQIDELKKIRGALPQMDALLMPKASPEALPKGLKPVFYDVLRHAGLGRNMGEIVGRLNYPDYEVCAAIAALLSKGMLEAGGPAGGHKDSAEDLITPDEAVMLRNAIARQASNASCKAQGRGGGRIQLISGSGDAARRFINRCSTIRGFSEDGKNALYGISRENPFGIAGSIRFYGITDVIIFAVPGVTGAGPLCRSFSSGLIGLILLLDKASLGSVSEIKSLKEFMLTDKKVPCAHVFMSQGKTEDMALELRKAFNVREDEANSFFIVNQDSGPADVFRHIIRGNIT